MKTISRKAGTFTIDVVEETRAKRELHRLRQRSGKRRSKYADLAEACAQLEEGEVLRTFMGKTEVGGLRGYLKRAGQDELEVASSKTDEDDTYAVYVFRQNGNGGAS